MRIEGTSSIASVQRLDKVNNEEKLNELLINSRNMDSITVSGEKERKRYTEEELIYAIKKANKGVNVYDRRLEFSIHEETKEIMVKVVDTNTNEVIREIPPEKILDMVAKMWELAGILVDERI